jgi:preprotein translocase subunit SecA
VTAQIVDKTASNTSSNILVYKTVKADGSVVYSDIYSERTVLVDLSSINTVVTPALNKNLSQVLSQVLSKTPNQNNHVKKIRAEVQYIVSISSPVAEQTLRDNSGTVTINANVSPKNSGSFQLIFDNQLLKTQSKSQFQLESVNRGAHTIKVNFLDNSGKILASSKQQTFYLQKASALSNAK